jgi:cyclopropane fatty-acyl-phospholipid synthase-like methyltransferase
MAGAPPRRRAQGRWAGFPHMMTQDVGGFLGKSLWSAKFLRLMTKRRPELTARTADRHVLYERAVQSIPADLKFAERIFREQRRRDLRTLREDFCGTAALAASFVRRHAENRAYGVDLDAPTLDWGLTHHVARLTEDQAARITLLEANVLDAATPPVDLVLALNFSYSVFHDRAALLAYFQAARAALNDRGLLLVDAFGGTESMIEFEEVRRIPAGETTLGDPLPGFIYVWQQAKFNIVDHRILCHIHFQFRDGSRIRRAYTYDWRVWTLPELRELMREAGFRRADTYLHGWKAGTGRSDGVFRRRHAAENAESWLAYVVGVV